MSLPYNIENPATSTNPPMAFPQLRGIIPPIVTPMTADQELDHEGPKSTSTIC